MSRKNGECILEGDIFGVLTYIAPEVLIGKEQFTKAANIYRFGIIIVKISTKQRPFDGYEFSEELAL